MITDVAKSLFSVQKTNKTKPVFEYKEDVFLCHDVTVTFPTLVTPNSLAKLNGRVQPPPRQTIPEQLLGIQLTLMVQLIPKTMACMFSSPYHGHGHCTLASRSCC